MVNKQNKNNVAKKALAIAGAVAVAGAGVLGGIAYSNAQDNTELQSQIITLQSQLNTTQGVVDEQSELIVVQEQNISELNNQTPEVITEYVNQTVTEYVNQTVEVPVDNGDMDFVLERLEDKMIISDAEDIVEEFKAEDSALEGAIDYVFAERDEFFDMLEDAGIVVDEDDVVIKKVYSDFEDVAIVESDFDDEKYEFTLKYSIEDLEDEVYKDVFVTVRQDFGEFEIVGVTE